MFLKKKTKAIAVISIISLVALIYGALGLLSALGTEPMVRKIVVFNDDYVNADAQDALVKNFGDTLHDLPLINGKAVLLPPKAVASLEARAEVKRVEDDIIVKAVHHRPGHDGGPAGGGEEPQPAQTLPWGIDRIDADLARATSTGSAVKVAVIDTGIDKDHPDLIDNLKGGVLLISTKRYQRKGSDAWDDDNGHGTHVAGTVAAVNNDIGVVGAAPGAHLYGVKVLDSSGSGYASDVAAGIQWAADNGIQVINLSLGSSGESLAIRDAVVAAYNKGLTIVAAAGNSGPGEDTVIYPAKYPETIAVAASDQNDKIASFSSRGPEVDIAAPGVNILSTKNDGTYTTISGTSMATPHVAGTAALLLAINPLLSPDDVRTKLMATAENLGEPATAQGSGLVDAHAGVQ